MIQFRILREWKSSVNVSRTYVQTNYSVSPSNNIGMSLQVGFLEVKVC
jgi:hypothetical protein